MTNEETSTSGALVLQTKGPYRTIAQANWGLTNEEMKGMHVHHRIPQSLGGSNDPTNLYVCSPWFHAHVWHDRAFWIETAAKGGSMSLGRVMSDKTKAKMSASSLGRKKSAAHAKAIRKGKLGLRATEAHRASVSASRHKLPMGGTSHMNKTKTCPHCGMTAGLGLMSRWHFDNCKHKP